MALLNIPIAVAAGAGDGPSTGVSTLSSNTRTIQITGVFTGINIVKGTDDGLTYEEIARFDGVGTIEIDNSSVAIIINRQSPLTGLPIVNISAPDIAAVVVVVGIVTANQGLPNIDANSWPVHQVGAPPLAVGAATEATLLTRASEATLLTRATEATLATRLADATFTARINTLGQKVMAASTPVVIASDQSAIPTTDQKSATGTQSSVAGSAVNTTLLAANASRLGATLFNDSTQNWFVKLGAASSLVSFSVRIVPNAYYEVPFDYTGIITGIQNVANGNMRITELT